MDKPIVWPKTALEDKLKILFIGTKETSQIYTVNR
jgi:hypothetical protein